MQAERVRLWVARNGYDLISICQDGAHSGEREGFGAVLGIISSGQAELVVVPTLEALSPDKVTQEVMLFELRATGISVASTEDGDLVALSVPPGDPARMFIRDVLEKAAAFFVEAEKAFLEGRDDLIEDAKILDEHHDRP